MNLDTERRARERTLSMDGEDKELRAKVSQDERRVERRIKMRCVTCSTELRKGDHTGRKLTDDITRVAMNMYTYWCPGCGRCQLGIDLAEQDPSALVFVQIEHVGSSKFKVIKELRAITGEPLRNCKELVDAAPCVIDMVLSRDDAAIVEGRLKDVGASTRIVTSK